MADGLSWHSSSDYRCSITYLDVQNRTLDWAIPAIAVVIDYASKDRPEEVEALEQWMKRIIPLDRDVPHHYLAARALLGLTVHSRTYLAGRIARAFQKVRDRSSFSGWFSPKATRYARNATFYHRPKLEFDL